MAMNSDRAFHDVFEAPRQRLLVYKIERLAAGEGAGVDVDVVEGRVAGQALHIMLAQAPAVRQP